MTHHQCRASRFRDPAERLHHVAGLGDLSVRFGLPRSTLVAFPALHPSKAVHMTMPATRDQPRQPHLGVRMRIEMPQQRRVGLLHQILRAIRITSAQSKRVSVHLVQRALTHRCEFGTDHDTPLRYSYSLPTPPTSRIRHRMSLTTVEPARNQADETSKQDRQPLPNALAEQLTYPKCRFKALDDAERESRRRTSELRHTAAQAAHWIVPTTIAKHRETSPNQRRSASRSER